MINVNKRYKFIGFSLAEILITLVIIGVVATMTIPVVVGYFEEIAYKNAAKKAFAACSQAVNQMREDEGGTLASYVGNYFSFKPVFIKYLNVMKDCEWVSCLSLAQLTATYTSLSGDPETAANSFSGEGQFITTDGMFYNIQNSDYLPYGIIIMVDVNGYQKKPNTYGKDVFLFQLVNDNLKPMGAPDTFYAAPSYCNKNTHNSHQGLGCMVYVLSGKSY